MLFCLLLTGGDSEEGSFQMVCSNIGNDTGWGGVGLEEEREKIFTNILPAFLTGVVLG